MDAVPLKFVDSIAELFSLDTLNQLRRETRHPLWKPPVDLHYRNRVNYTIFFEKTEEGIEPVFFGDYDDEDVLKAIQENRRFARIVEVCDRTGEESEPEELEVAEIANWREKNISTEDIDEAETTKLLETVAPMIDQVSGKFYPDSLGQLLLPVLFKRVYLQGTEISYCGQIAYDFLEDQIDNSPFLEEVSIAGKNWPQSSLELLKKFCSKGKPGSHVEASVYCKDVVIDASYIQGLLDIWKASGNLNFRLYYNGDIKDKEGFEQLIYQGVVTRKDRGHKVTGFFVHETEKSIARVSSSYSLMECFTCECDQFEKCHMKEKFPERHYLLSIFQDQKYPALCHSCDLKLPTSQFFDCSRCSSSLGVPEVLVCAACVLRKHSDHIPEVSEAYVLSAEEVAEALAMEKLDKCGAEAKNTIQTIKTSPMTRKTLNGHIDKLKLIYEEIKKASPRFSYRD
uniref:ZZ-type domain-containing protein n=1 Tax=Steinernema glaseri TaxID=37863 RepID=A0A1I7YT88_9BILA